MAIKSISPSALAKFEKDRDQYYLSYLANPRPPQEAQARPASVGSAFDAYVKAELMHRLFGKSVFIDLFESSVEPHNRDFAFQAGRYVFESYKYSGAFTDLLGLMHEAREEPQFEFKAGLTVDEIPLAGKPDCRFVHKDGAHIILDWKVNGFCGKTTTSPSKGYALCRDGIGWDKPSRSHFKSHELFQPVDFMGLVVNKFFMEQVSIDWADQLTMYGWMMGEPVGSEHVVACIEQVVANASEEGSYPKLRIANHRNRVSPAHQFGLLQRLKIMWGALQEGHIFTDLDSACSSQKCRDLDNRALSMQSDGTSEGDFFAKCARVSTTYKTR